MAQLPELRRFQLEPETRELAVSLLHAAQLRTAPGSGHELGQANAGLPAICAYIACKRLNSTEVDLKTAQIASCIQASVFKKALNTVESVLKTDSSSMKTEGKDTRAYARQTYAVLLQNHSFQRHINALLFYLIEAEDTLVASGELPGSDLKRFTLLRCVVFGWTCGVFKAKHVSHELMKKKYDLDSDAYDDLLRVMGSACSNLADTIRREREQMQKRGKELGSSALVTPTPSPTKFLHSRLSTLSPDKAVLERESSSFTPIEQLTPTKRKVTFAETADEDDETDMYKAKVNTSSKKRARIMPPTPSTSVTPSKSGRSSIPRASSSRVKLEFLEDRDEPMELEESSLQTQADPLHPIMATSKAPPTTRRLRQISPPIRKSPGSELGILSSAMVEDKSSIKHPPGTRFRPTYLDHKQWFSRDPRIDREINKAEEIGGRLTQIYGPSMILNQR